MLWIELGKVDVHDFRLETLSYVARLHMLCPSSGAAAFAGPGLHTGKL